MKLLLIAASYPHRGHSFAGVFSQRSAEVLQALGEEVHVLAPRPFVPPIIRSFAPRWRSYAQIPSRETRNGIDVLRPAYPHIPRVVGSLCFDLVSYLFSRRLIKALHRRTSFDAILAFNLIAAGLAWRLSDDLRIPACGWASGDDIRVPPSSSLGRIVRRTLSRLEVVFYQSHELREKAAEILGTAPGRLSAQRHVVLPRGIPAPPPLSKIEARKRVREELGVPDDAILVLSIGRMTRDKGIYEILEAISMAAVRNPRITGVVVGSMPAYDETASVQALLSQSPSVGRHLRVVPACEPERVWEYLCGADIFLFTSHREGMPNSLLEAMAMGVPAAAFSIPAVVEIDAGRRALYTVPPLDVGALSDVIIRLAASPEERASLGERGRRRVMEDFMVTKSMREAVRRIGEVLQERRAARVG